MRAILPAGGRPTDARFADEIVRCQQQQIHRTTVIPA
jgi:hypothetical protein